MLKELARRGRSFSAFWDNRPPLVYKVRSFNETLVRDVRAAVLMKMQDEPGSTLGVATNTWSSAKDLQDWPTAATAVVCKLFQIYLGHITGKKEWDITAWCNVMNIAGRIDDHDHWETSDGGHNVWSGVFYVTGGSDIVFKWCGLRLYRVTPRPGLMVIFPSHVTHYAEEWKGPGNRISVAFNAR